MPDHQGGKSAPKAGKGLLRLSLGLFGIFFANVIGGKCNMAFQWKLPHWDGLAEFLLLAAATTMLIGAALKREEAESKNQNLNQKEAGNE